MAALALTGCTSEPGDTGDPDKRPDAGMASDDLSTSGGGGDMAMLTGLPCEVSDLLKAHCLSCHGQPPKGAPISLATYSDLIATSPAMPAQTVAERALIRMQDKMRPMPPAPAPMVPAAEIAAFKAWVDAGAKPGSCMPKPTDMGGGGGDMRGGGGDMRGGGGDMGGSPDMATDPIDSAPKCSSGKTWTGGNMGSPNMHPGRACITCHKMRGPNLAIAGTVYPSGHEPDDCIGAAGMGAITIEITGKDGKVFTLPVNTNGNFLLSAMAASTLQLPYHAKVKQGTKERAMSSPQMSGDCNSCHTQTGASGAPGRITLPFP